MSGAELGLATSVFLACAVEAVEALTIVLAVGATRRWSSALAGAGAAIIALGAIVLALGPAIIALPLDVLRVVVGGLLLLFGLQWLSKAVLRSAGLKAKHDELLAYEHEAETARTHAMPREGFDAYAFALSFKGVFLEGLEVAFIVLTFGANQHHVGLAAAAAGAAVLMVIIVGLAVRAPLTRVPENTLKLAVGVMLTAFGTFWAAEGAGAHWPADEAALLILIPGILAAALILAGPVSRAALRNAAAHVGPDERRIGVQADPSAHAHARDSIGWAGVKRLLSPARAVWRFIVGEDWRTAGGIILALALTALVANSGIAAWWIMPLAVFVLLALAIRRFARGVLRREPTAPGMPVSGYESVS